MPGTDKPCGQRRVLMDREVGVGLVVLAVAAAVVAAGDCAGEVVAVAAVVVVVAPRDRR